MTTYTTPFTRIHLTGRELDYVREAIESRRLAGDGTFSRRCEALIEQLTGCGRALLTPSCTAALEMSAILADAGPGDEIVMPSFTFVSTANAFVLRGATPVFVDVEPESFTIDPARVADAVTPKTRAIVPVHYGGHACDLDAIAAIAEKAGAIVIEDAAQALLSSHHGRPLGSFGGMAALSFHETKNITSGEGGALLINDPALVARAEVVREKGTDRSRFFRGEIDKYTWVDVGSSYLPNELTAAFLLAQLEQAREITAARIAVWRRYHEMLEPLEREGRVVRPAKTPDAGGNGHVYYVLLPSLARRSAAIRALGAKGIYAAFHYVPLHSSPGGKRFGRTASDMRITDDVSQRLLRLPLWPDMASEDVEQIVSVLAVL